MTRYDDALPQFAALVKELMGQEAVYDHLFLRDAAGKLTFITLKHVPEDDIARLCERAKKLIPWVERDSPVAKLEHLFDESLSDPAAASPELINHQDFHGWVRVVERRIVGQDWLRAPLTPIPDAPPVVVFASQKGGVGRSTALAVAANALSQQVLPQRGNVPFRAT